MWLESCLMYQIYPIGFCGAPKRNDGSQAHLFGLIEDIIPHLKQMHVTAIMLNPVIKSSSHGYDTIDMFHVDNRLGTDEEFKSLVEKMHENGIKVVYDGVFNHVGREFPQFVDVRKNKQNSKYKDWFYIDFNGNNRYNDGFSYLDWQGADVLVKLDLDNPETLGLVLDAVTYWITYYGIDGIRLDAANLLPDRFFSALKAHIAELKPDFPLIGEQVHIFEQVNTVKSGLLDSLTNYECYKSMLFSVNQLDLSDIEYTLSRVYAPDAFAGKPLLNFLDNHDVARIASNVSDRRDLELLYVMMYSLPGVPCIYYGSEFSVLGNKRTGDYFLRPEYKSIDKSNTDIMRLIIRLEELRASEPDMIYGGYERVYVNNMALVIRRGSIYFAFNILDRAIPISVNGFDATVPPHGYVIKKNGKVLAMGEVKC